MEQESDNTVLGFIGVIVFLPLIYLLEGFVFVKMWKWFVVPQFGLPPVSLPEAIGLVAIVGYLNSKARKDTPDFAEIAAHTLMAAVITLLVGWLASLCL